MMKLTKNQTNLAVGATILGVGYYLMSQPGGALAGLGHAIPHKHGLHVHAGKHKRGVRNSKKLVDREGSEEMRSLPLPIRRGKQSSRGRSPVSAKKGMPVRRRRSRKPRKAIRVRDRSVTNPNFKKKAKKQFDRPLAQVANLAKKDKSYDEVRSEMALERQKYANAIIPLSDFERMQTKMHDLPKRKPNRGIMPHIQGLGMTTSTSTSTSSSHVPEIMRRQNEEQWNHKEAHIGDLFGAAPPSIRNRVSHRLAGSESYHAKIEPNFSANHSTVQKIDAIRNIDLLGYSGMEVGQSNGDWIL